MSTTQIPQPLSEIPENDFQKELEKLRYQAQLDIYKLEHQRSIEITKLEITTNIEREKADWANEYALDQEIQRAYIAIAQGQIDRVRANADFVQKISAAISTAYIGILALTFGVGEYAEPLPITGILPAIFLGLSFVYAAFFIAYITPSRKGTIDTYNFGTLSAKQIIRRNNFIKWSNSLALRRKGYLQASVISLGIGILFFPVPYLDLSVTIQNIPAQQLITICVVGGIILTTIPVFWGLIKRK